MAEMKSSGWSPPGNGFELARHGEQIKSLRHDLDEHVRDNRETHKRIFETLERLTRLDNRIEHLASQLTENRVQLHELDQKLESYRKHQEEAAHQRAQLAAQQEQVRAQQLQLRIYLVTAIIGSLVGVGGLVTTILTLILH